MPPLEQLKPGQGQTIDVGEVWHPQFYPTSLYEVVECLHPTEGGTEESAQAQVILKFLADESKTIRRTVHEMFKGWAKANPAPLPIEVVLGLADDVKQARAELLRLARVVEETTRAVTAQRVRVNELEDMFHTASQMLLK